MENLIKELTATGIIPVVKIDNAEDAVGLATALRNAGINCIEITFRTAAAEQAIKNIAKAYPDMLIIAGTVLTEEQADTAMNAGAKAVVAPGLNPTVVANNIKKGYPVIPGVCTPSEVEIALSLGLTYLKFFPAEAAGGVNMIKSMAAPYTNVKFMPTGGISTANLANYINCKAVFCCGGSWMVPADKITNGEFSEIEKLATEAVALLKEIRK